MNAKNVLLLLILSLLSCLSFGQDFHYWTDQFGIKATALGGAVVGGQDDHSMVFYNAAAMSLVQNPSLSFSINAYQYRTFKQKNGLGPGQNLESSDYATIPNMMAGIFVFRKNPKWRVGYQVISRNVYNNKLDLYNSGNYDALDLPGDETFVSSYAYEIHTGEYWAGLSVSYQATPHLSFGLSHMGAYKTTKYYNNYSITVLPPDTSSSEITRFASTMSFNYWNVKALFKPSMLLQYPKFRLGMTFTLPSISVIGKGNFYREISTLNMNDILPIDFAVISQARKSKAQHKLPASFSLGISTQLGAKCWLHLSAETFLAQKYYLIHKGKEETEHYPAILSDSLITDLFGKQAFLSYGEEYKPVTNVGIGLDLKLSDQLSLQCGAHTDFNYNKFRVYEFSRQTIQATQYDRMVTSVGGNYLLNNGKRFALAFEFGFSLPKTTDYAVDFTTPNEARNGLLGDTAHGAKTYAYSYKLMFELTLGKIGR
ncbi:Outer membrane protein transport protein (OMPP1/FadL/TodX) [compost metagenome]